MSILVTWEPTDAEWQIIRDTWPDDTGVLALAELSDDELAAALPEVEVMVGYMRTIPKPLLATAPALRLVHVLGHGVDQLLSPEVADVLRARDILLARSNPATINIAEFIIMQMIALSRRVVGMHNRLVMHGDWSTEAKAKRGAGSLGGELYESTLGLIGYGNIAREVHTRAAAFGMEVGALARSVERHADRGLDFIHPWDDIDAFLGRCDYVVVTLPLTPGTTDLIDAGRLKAMKDGAYIVNVSRGRIIDEEALYEALAEGRLAGAALDVFDVEETKGWHGYPTPRPLHQFNVILTPHYAGATAEARRRALSTVGDNVRRLRRGEPLRNLAALDKGF